MAVGVTQLWQKGDTQHLSSAIILRSIILAAALTVFLVQYEPSSVLAKDLSLWRFEVIDSGGVTGLCTSAGLDSQGRAHISYYDITAQRVQVASRTDDGWLIEPLSLCGG